MKTLNSQIVKAEASSLGFYSCGLSLAQRVSKEEEERQTKRIAEGRHADMTYLERNTEMRLDPRLLVDGAKTVISLALNYLPPDSIDSEGYEFARYAYGKDYHVVVKNRIHELFLSLKQIYPTIEGRAFCDTAPVLERYWAEQSGLGWIGRNTQLIIPHAGSFFFLGELIVNLEADNYDKPMASHCGSCRRCIEACPMKALTEDGGLDARLCLSYLTIENRGDIPDEAASRMGNCIYGCDRCAEACPHNKFAEPTSVEEFQPSKDFLAMKREDWTNLTVEQYRELFRGSAVKRAKFEGLCRNIRAASGEKESGEN